MNIYSLDEINSVYSILSDVKVTAHSVSWINLQTFNRNISKLFKTIADGGRDEFWYPIVSLLKRFRFDVSAAPLSSDILRKKLETLSSELRSKTKLCNAVFGSELATMLGLLADQAQELSGNVETGLLDMLVDLVSKSSTKDGAIAICESRLIPLVEETIEKIAELRRCAIVNPSNLRDIKCYSNVYFIGAPKWFPEYVFASPRSRELHVIKHKWISGSWKPELVLVSPYKHFGNIHPSLEIVDDISDFVEDNPQDLIPRIDLQQILDNAFRQTISLMNVDDDVVVAKLLLLDNDWAVFLDADENSVVDIIDLDEEIEKRVRRASLGDIQPGIFILLRTEGGGDYIVPVADQIMGNFKEKARSVQKQWKTLLRDYVKKEGVSKTLNELRNLGSTRANSLNLNHWISLRGIRTESYDDFLGIMKLVGLDKDAKSIWDTMGIIRNAHTKAGFTIRSMLLDQVNKSNINRLKQYGKMDFELVEQGAGSLSAFRIIEIATETVEVIHWRIGEPFRIELNNDKIEVI